MRLRPVLPLMVAALFTASAVLADDDAAPGWIGMGYTWSTAGDHKILNVQKVAPGGPAERAGIKPGDIITTINERRVDFGDELDLLLYLGSRKPGDRLTLKVIREGRARTFEVKLGTMPEGSRAAWKQNLEVARRKRAAEEQKRNRD